MSEEMSMVFIVFSSFISAGLAVYYYYRLIVSIYGSIFFSEGFTDFIQVVVLNTENSLSTQQLKLRNTASAWLLVFSVLLFLSSFVSN